MSLSTYRGLTLVAAWFVGVPGILLLAIAIFELFTANFYYPAPEPLEFVIYLFLASSVVAPAVFRSDLRENAGVRLLSTVYYGILALCGLGFGAALAAIMTVAPPELRGLIAGMNVLFLLLVILMVTITIIPFFPDSNAYFRRLALFKSTVDRIRAGELSVDQARAEALPAISIPKSLPAVPPSMKGFILIFIALMVFNVAQWGVLPALLDSMSESATERLGVQVSFSPIVSVVIFSVIVVIVWVMAGTKTYKGSAAARVFLTVLLVGNIVVSIWLAFEPAALSFSTGFASIIDIPAWFWTLTVVTSLVSIAASSTMLFLLYRPLSNRYFVGTHYYLEGGRLRDDDLSEALALQARPTTAWNGAGAPLQAPSQPSPPGLSTPFPVQPAPQPPSTPDQSAGPGPTP